MNNGLIRTAICFVVMAGDLVLMPMRVYAQPPEGIPAGGAAWEKFNSYKFGLFVHQTYADLGTGHPVFKTNIPDLDAFANGFNVEGFANDVKSMGVELLVFTAWHRQMNALAPLASLEKYLPGHTSKRDLLGEILDTMAARGIAVMFYVGPKFGFSLTQAEQRATGWLDPDGIKPEDKKFRSYPVPRDNFKKWNDFQNEIFAELTKRYISRPNFIGYWIDNFQSTCDTEPAIVQIDGARLVKTIKDIGPNLTLLSNYNSNRRMNPPAEYAAKSYERYDFWKGAKQSDFQTFDKNTAMLYGEWWSNARTINVADARQIFCYTVLAAGTSEESGVLWSAAPCSDGTSWGVSNCLLTVMQDAYAMIKPIEKSIKGTLISRNWKLKPASYPKDCKNLPIACTRSADGREDYVHVLTPPAGGARCITLTTPTDSFKAAYNLRTRNPVAMKTLSDGRLELTLADKDQWHELDTVIGLERGR
jgi:hypothetical protein